MSKAVFVTNMPKSCPECLAFCGYYSDMICRLNGKSIHYPVIKEKPSWCPLRELPGQKPYNRLLDRMEEHEYDIGWNACLDNIYPFNET